MSYASPVSSMTERAERALANMRFSDFGRRTGPRLPIPMDYSQARFHFSWAFTRLKEQASTFITLVLHTTAGLVTEV
jgi:hypothetical protein